MIKRWILRTFFQKELGGLIAEWLFQFHEAKEIMANSGAHEYAYQTVWGRAMNTCARRLALAMGQDLSWHE